MKVFTSSITQTSPLASVALNNNSNILHHNITATTSIPTTTEASPILHVVKGCENISTASKVKYRQMQSHHNISELFKFHGFDSKGGGITNIIDDKYLDERLMSIESPCVCEFAIVGQSFQMAHGMQQLYRCITWWRYCSSKGVDQYESNNDNNSKKEWVLIWRKDPASGNVNRYMTGVIQAYQDVFNVKVVSEAPSSPRVTALIPHTTRSNKYPHYAMRTPIDTMYMRESIINYYNLMKGNEDDKTDDSNDIEGSKSSSTTRTSTTTTPTSVVSKRLVRGGCKPNKNLPVIGILNRADDRKVLNIRNLVTRLKHELDYPNNDDLNHLEVTYFENKTFYEQIQWMNSVDILLSSHGAQLVSIPFMPSSSSTTTNNNGGGSCSGLIEFFQRGYFVSYCKYSYILHGIPFILCRPCSLTM